MSKLIFSTCVCMLTLGWLQAQRQSDWIRLGDEAMAEGDHYGALHYYQRAMDLDSAQGSLRYKYADALRLNERYSQAAYQYHQVYRREQGRLYPLSGVWLASMLQQSGKYGEAKETWRRVRRQYAADTTSYYYQKAVQAMRACDMAVVWRAAPPPFSLKPAPEPVNSPASELAGLFLHADTLLFASVRPAHTADGQLLPGTEGMPALYRSVAPQWQAIPLQVPPGASYATAYARNADGLQAWAVVDTAGEHSILLADRDAYRMVPCGGDRAWCGHPSFGRVNGREVLFFASNRSGGYGREDLWYVGLSAEDQPVNAGPMVNTPGSEITPFYRRDEGQLFFASDWHYGMGGYDLFKVHLENSEVSLVENLKPPYSGPANDLYYSFDVQSGKGTITSNRAGVEREEPYQCCSDLFIFTEAQASKADSLPQITSLEALNAYLPVELYFHNDEPNPRSTADSTALTYTEAYQHYVSLLPTYQAAYSEGLSEHRGEAAENAMDAFFIQEVDQGMQDLQLFARLLLRELQEGAHVRLQVRGFASPLAKSDYNVHLTSRRISSLVNYLRKYEGGALLPFLRGRDGEPPALVIDPQPFGEYAARAGVSDNPNEADAIYGLRAASERKIVLESVSSLPLDTALAELELKSSTLELGVVKPGAVLPFEVSYRASSDLQVDSVSYDPKVIRLLQPPTAGGGLIRGTVHIPPEVGKHVVSIVFVGNMAGERRLDLLYEVL